MRAASDAEEMMSQAQMNVRWQEKKAGELNSGGAAEYVLMAQEMYDSSMLQEAEKRIGLSRKSR